MKYRVILEDWRRYELLVVADSVGKAADDAMVLWKDDDDLNVVDSDVEVVSVEEVDR
jgi:hypothetical protein